jgi:hypothetical protein
MMKFLTTTAVVLFIGAAPALAVDDTSKIDEPSTMPQASQLPNEPGTSPEASEPSRPHAASQDDGQLPTQSTVSPDVAKEAVQPGDGERDTSGGAMERSSAPPESGAASAGSSTSDAASPDLATPESEIERGPAAAEKPDSAMEPDTSKE